MRAECNPRSNVEWGALGRGDTPSIRKLGADAPNGGAAVGTKRKATAQPAAAKRVQPWQARRPAACRRLSAPLTESSSCDENDNDDLADGSDARALAPLPRKAAHAQPVCPPEAEPCPASTEADANDAKVGNACGRTRAACATLGSRAARTRSAASDATPARSTLAPAAWLGRTANTTGAVERQAPATLKPSASVGACISDGALKPFMCV
ncbi:hypothetical protein KFE25_002910 [Diacronema lutheri]|uniref:Uncharacterized protein n=1 Tax=Diacronema lutheri TaxID=2081491 RepID=A0A8J5XER5_DIALT|nr:hypothetical protein KFE25_002910 [Diacronema lutheri]